ncbi:hypothetical protein GDO86_009192 [Hymenochirus boettgeri]|uniref:PNK FHA domain-containing protein n=1 Tax=Hymenochirus boettgeri TaxID=247094 RepID=A0A8T2JN29_9PIPI|nr:hypothetical protein GDO86_009192 [Hymenochirus boettgeri]
MSGYLLEATDGGGRTPLPSGETMIGRGPFLHISDKRVSRNHALLEVVDDKLRIKPVHVNPCFYQGTSENTFLPLEKDKWHSLHCGDCFSLLPDKYAFRVVTANFSKDSTERAIYDISKVNTSNENDRESWIAIKKEPSAQSGILQNKLLCIMFQIVRPKESKTIQSIYLPVSVPFLWIGANIAMHIQDTEAELCFPPAVYSQYS